MGVTKYNPKPGRLKGRGRDTTLLQEPEDAHSIVNNLRMSVDHMFQSISFSRTNGNRES